MRKAQAVGDGGKTGAKGPGDTVKSKAKKKKKKQGSARLGRERAVGAPGTQEDDMSHQGLRNFQSL